MSDAHRLHPLLNGLVDYAGLFPPARLPLKEAVETYVRHLRGDDAGMLGRFICPADRLDELHGYSGSFDTEHPLRLSLIVKPGGLDEAMPRAESFVRSFGAPARIEAVETRVADDRAGAAARGRLCATADRVAPIPVYVEVPVAHDPGVALAILAEYGPARRSGRANLGAKIRCGGDEAADYPSTGAVAAFVHRCVMDGVPFKATAGLHHPVRGVPSGQGPPMHGFLNVFGAAVLGATLGLSESKMEAIVAETDTAAFSLADGQFAWKDLTAPLPAVQAVRAALATGLGSCSFDEPADDLHALGWLRTYS